MGDSEGLDLVMSNAGGEMRCGRAASDLPCSLEDLIISLDLDGTLAFGDPPGAIAPALVRTLQETVFVVGSASDRTVLDQSRLWQRAGLEPGFVVVKNHLRHIASRYPGRRLVHIGDRFADYLEARNAGALFLHVESLSCEEWCQPEAVFQAIVREFGSELNHVPPGMPIRPPD